MAYKTKLDGSTDKTIKLGGEGNPTSIEGYFLGSKTTQSDYGPGKLHIFMTQEGTVGVWGKTRLDRLLTPDLVGQMCLATFTGMIAPVKKGRKPSYGYRVDHDPDNTTDVSGLNLNASNNEEEVNTYEEEAIEEEETYSPPTAPRKAASAPSTASQSKVQQMLASHKNNR